MTITLKRLSKKGNNKKLYLNKMVVIYSLVIYVAIIITCFAFFLYMYRDEVEEDVYKEQLIFGNYVESLEESYDELIHLANELKTLHEVYMLMFAGEDTFYKELTALTNEWATYSMPYRRNGYNGVMFREDYEAVVETTGTTRMRVLLENWNIDADVLEEAILYMNSGYENNYTIWTDRYIFYITSKQYLDHVMYFICFKDMTAFMPLYQELDDSIYFWSDSEGVKDLRTEGVPESILLLHEQAKSDVVGSNLIHNTEDGVFYSYYSRNFDIVYGSVTDQNSVVLFLSMQLLIFFMLVPLYGIIYVVTRRILQVVYKPIEELVNVLTEDEEESDMSKGELHFILNQVKLMKNQNDEFRDKLDELMKGIHSVQTSAVGEVDAIEEDDELKEKLIQYVSEHISEDISLSDLADHFGLSFNYMSVVFKNKMNNNFKEYLSYQRYLCSLEIMRKHPKMKIADIAEKVGIANVNTFIRVFKKYNAMTPKQYMSLNQK